MGNWWDYNVVLREPPADRADLLRRVLGLARSLGYALPSDAFSAFDETGEGHTLQGEDGFVRWASAQDGGAPLLNGEGNDIFLSLHDREVRLGLGPLIQGRDEPLARDAEALFIQLCNTLDPLYGYSSDESLVETVLRDEDFLAAWQAFKADIQARRPPRLLFWLNYFATDYLAQIGREPVFELATRLVPLEDQGVFVYLSDHPWQARLATLEAHGAYRIAARH